MKKTELIQVRVGVELKKAAEAKALAENSSVAQKMRDLLTKWLEDRK